MKFRNFFKALKKDERGVSALEYAILAGLIVGAVVTGVTAFKDKIDTAFTNLGDQLEQAVPPVPPVKKEG